MLGRFQSQTGMPSLREKVSLGRNMGMSAKKHRASCSSFEKGDKGNLRVLSASVVNNTLEPRHTLCDI